MRKVTAIPLLIRHWMNGVFLALLMGLVAAPAVAALSDKTGQIRGQAPAAAGGNLLVLFPDGVTLLDDNAILNREQIPNQFKVSSSTAGLVLQDADGDSGLSALADIEQATLTWKHDGTELTPTQLAAPLGDNFSGQTLTLEVSAPVTVSSVTGLPTTAGPQVLTSDHRYMLHVVSGFTGVSVNEHTFGVAEGFPTTGFTGASFALNVTGSVSDYTWDNGGNSWVTVDDNGKVAFTAQGDSSPVTITATPKAGGAPLTYTFSVNNWFTNNGSTTMNWNDAANWCATQGRNPTRAELTQGISIRNVGSLWSEWGNMLNYSGFSSGYYWTSEADGSGIHYNVYLISGGGVSRYDSSFNYVVCRQGL